MPEVAIAIAVQADLPRILALQKAAYVSEAEIYNDFTLAPLGQSLAEVEEEFDRRLFLKAESGGRIVGSVRAFEQDGVCHIGRLAVQPSFQNAGLGGRLLAQMESRFPKVGAFELFTGSKSGKSLHLYAKHGYHVHRRQKISDALTLVFLQKRNQPPMQPAALKACP